MTPTLAYPSASASRGCLGMVVPAWYPAGASEDAAARLLRTTLAECDRCAEPRHTVVVTDGSPVAAAAARQLLVEQHGAEPPFVLLERPENRGKGAALAAGFDHLLADPAVAWIAARDADGDHLVDDLPHLYRAGLQLAEEQPAGLHCVIGRRASVHAPLGWLRGEYEWLLNDVIVDAVAFALAKRDRAWDSRFLAARVPDLQSGYKLYSAAAARAAVMALRGESAAAPELDLLRVGMEVVPFVTLALEGAIFAEVERKTYYDQPVTSYGSVDRTVFYGRKLAWALRRCAVPPAAAATLLDSALSRRPLLTDPNGRVEALRLRELVLQTLAGAPVPPETASADLQLRRFL